MITISANSKKEFISKDNLDDVLRWLRMNHIRVTDVNYENSGLYKQLHIHALAFTTRGFRWKPFIQYGDNIHCIGFRVQWVRVHDMVGALGYIRKDTHNNPIKQDQIFISNYYSAHYFNMDLQRYIRL